MTPTALVDYAAVATDLSATLSPAMEAAIGVGVLVFAAVMVWGIFKRLAK